MLLTCAPTPSAAQAPRLSVNAYSGSGPRRDPCAKGLAFSYAFGAAAGDTAASPVCDDCYYTVPLSRPLGFCGLQYSTVFIENNGILSFGAGTSVYVPAPFPIAGMVVIAPFWVDIDTRAAVPAIPGFAVPPNRVYYRAGAPAPADAARVAADVAAAHPGEAPFTPISFIAATWFAVGYFAEHTDKLSTLQAVVAASADGRTFAVLCQDNLVFDTGDVSVGRYANIGFNAGDGVHFYSMPGSFTPQDVTVTCQTPSGCSVFRVDGSTIVAPSPASQPATTLSAPASASASTTAMVTPSATPHSTSSVTQSETSSATPSRTSQASCVAETLHRSALASAQLFAILPGTGGLAVAVAGAVNVTCPCGRLVANVTATAWVSAIDEVVVAPCERAKGSSLCSQSSSCTVGCNVTITTVAPLAGPPRLRANWTCAPPPLVAAVPAVAAAAAIAAAVVVAAAFAALIAVCALVVLVAAAVRRHVLSKRKQTLNGGGAGGSGSGGAPGGAAPPTPSSQQPLHPYSASTSPGGDTSAGSPLGGAAALASAASVIVVTAAGAHAIACVSSCHTPRF